MKSMRDEFLGFLLGVIGIILTIYPELNMK